MVLTGDALFVGDVGLFVGDVGRPDFGGPEGASQRSITASRSYFS